MEGALGALPPSLPYLPMSMDMSDGSKYRDKPRGRGYSSYSDGYGSSDLHPSDSYGSYGGSQVILAVHLFSICYSITKIVEGHFVILVICLVSRTPICKL